MDNKKLFYFTQYAKYAYSIYGKGPPVLLLHGFTGKGSTWKQLVNVLKSNWKVIVLDLPGHGETLVEKPRSMTQFCSDLSQFLSFLQVEKIHLVGYSLGGRTALSFAMLYPNRILSLILESASPGLEKEEERIDRKKYDYQLAKTIEQNGISYFVHFWESIPLFKSQRKLPKSIRDSIRKERLSHTEEGLAQSLRYMGTGSQPSWWDQLEKLDVPVQLITGDQDKKFVHINHEMKKLLPNVTMQEVKNTGHCVHVEQPNTFNTIVIDFLHKIESGGTLNDSSMEKG